MTQLLTSSSFLPMKNFPASQGRPRVLCQLLTICQVWVVISEQPLKLADSTRFSHRNSNIQRQFTHSYVDKDSQDAVEWMRIPTQIDHVLPHFPALAFKVQLFSGLKKWQVKTKSSKTVCEWLEKLTHQTKIWVGWYLRSDEIERSWLRQPFALCFSWLKPPQKISRLNEMLSRL